MGISFSTAVEPIKMDFQSLSSFWLACRFRPLALVTLIHFVRPPALLFIFLTPLLLPLDITTSPEPLSSLHGNIFYFMTVLYWGLYGLSTPHAASARVTWVFFCSSLYSPLSRSPTATCSRQTLETLQFMEVVIQLIPMTA
jgi:hypothetical protein